MGHGGQLLAAAAGPSKPNALTFHAGLEGLALLRTRLLAGRLYVHAFLAISRLGRRLFLVFGFFRRFGSRHNVYQVIARPSHLLRAGRPRSVVRVTPKAGSSLMPARHAERKACTF